jgi:hypothetical protein
MLLILETMLDAQLLEVEWDVIGGVFTSLSNDNG